MKTQSLKPSPSVLQVAVALMALSLPPGVAWAQTSTETKIHLLAEVLRARDAGELELAKTRADQLLALAPNDASVQRLVQQVDALLATRDTAAASASPVASAETDGIEPASVSPGVVATAATAANDDPSAQLAAEADAAALAETQRVEALLAEVPAWRRQARELAARERYDEAIGRLDDALAALPLNPLTQSAVSELFRDRDACLTARAAAAAMLAQSQSAGLISAANAPPAAPREIPALVAKGRAQYLAGELDAARDTFRTVAARDPDNAAARDFLRRIARDKAGTGEVAREEARAQLLGEVAQSWRRPGSYVQRGHESERTDAVAPLARKLEEIVLPGVSFTRVEIGKVVAALGAMAEEFDPAPGPKGVNIVLLDPGSRAPTVTLALRNTTLKRVLDFVTESTGYRYDVQPDAVVVRPGGETSALDTGFFPIARATVLRMTGGAPAAKPDPLSSVPAGATSADEATGMRAFLQQAGVNFEAVAGASLAYDGSALIVTQTARNLDRIRNILTRYNDVRQVEIEAKFMEVQAGALDELGVRWSLTDRGTKQAYFSSQNRSLADAFTATSGGQSGSIVTQGAGDGGDASVQTMPIVNTPPTLPGGVNLGDAAGLTGLVTGVIDQFHVSAMIRALSQQQGTDLLSAPKITVLSGNPASITVAQEMRYPQSYGQTQAQVGTGSASGGGSAGVAITTGTPQEFTMRNVGVELRVTPTVEEDDYSISLDLNPRVTEFDGFVEYGGPSIAISGGTTVNVPSGFYQPIFSVRDITTKVTIWDGATLVMGGLTREEVKKVSDKVPVLGDLPLIGRAFRSKGESAQKRNLLIFVTANLVSPGGAPKNQALRGSPAVTLFQNPTIITPAGAEPRPGTEAEAAE